MMRRETWHLYIYIGFFAGEGYVLGASQGGRTWPERFMVGLVIGVTAAVAVFLIDRFNQWKER